MKGRRFDRRAMEKTTADLTNLLQKQNFTSEEELNTFLDKVVKGKKIPKSYSKTADQMAQDIIYDAWETEGRSERIKLAKKALAVSPNCADAYNLLAEDSARSVEEAKELYQKGVEAGRRALGKKVFKENRGHFWGYVVTRPYMRSLAGVMECLWSLGEHDRAIEHAKEMLKLNKNDNQGIRYILIGYLSALGRFDELDKFMNKGAYKNDCAAEWHYTKALLSFVKEGATDKAEKDLHIALNINKHVPDYLTGRKPIPRELPDRISMGGEDEAFCYAASNLIAWRKVPGSIDWLMEKTGIKPVPKTGRNEPCPCGSGKKYKKCCGMD